MIRNIRPMTPAHRPLPGLLDEVERLRRRNEVLWNALWKASGDHEPHVAANLESVGGNPADFMSADTYGEHDDRQ